MVPAGWLFVVVGGLVAAVTGPLELEHGSWLAAYLVLVCGVATSAIGAMQTRPGTTPMPRVRSQVQLGSWTIGNAAVIVGTLGEVPWIVDVGAAFLVVALVVALVHTATAGTLSTAGTVQWLTLWTYRALLVVLVVSVPIGVVLAHLDPST